MGLNPLLESHESCLVREIRLSDGGGFTLYAPTLPTRGKMMQANTVIETYNHKTGKPERWKLSRFRGDLAYYVPADA